MCIRDSSQKTVSVFDLMGRSVNDVRGDLQQFAFDLAGTTMFTANDIMDSMYGMAQAGMQVEDVYAIMPEVINLATAQSTDCLLYTSDAADERSSVDLGG